MNLPFKIGILSEVRPGYAKVYFAEDDISTDWWPVIRKTSLKDFESWPLNVNEHVVCLCDQHLEEGVILGCIQNEVDTGDPGAAPGKFRAVFEDGTVIEYDKGSSELTASVNGSVKITATGDIEATTQANIKAQAVTKATIQAPNIELIGNVTVTGVVSAGGISAAPLSGVPGANGKITAGGDIETSGEIKGSDVKAGTTSLKTHTHGLVQPGNGASGPPL